jgi:hypothetical protein
LDVRVDEALAVVEELSAWYTSILHSLENSGPVNGQFTAEVLNIEEVGQRADHASVTYLRATSVTGLLVLVLVLRLPSKLNIRREIPIPLVKLPLKFQSNPRCVAVAPIIGRLRDGPVTAMQHAAHGDFRKEKGLSLVGCCACTCAGASAVD